MKWLCLLTKFSPYSSNPNLLRQPAYSTKQHFMSMNKHPNTRQSPHICLFLWQGFGSYELSLGCNDIFDAGAITQRNQSRTKFLSSPRNAKDMQLYNPAARLSFERTEFRFTRSPVHSVFGANIRHYSSSNVKVPQISNIVYQYFREESKILSDTLNLKRDDSNFSRVDVSRLDKCIQKELSEQMDDYNRFIVLLSHHPLSVPLQVLLNYFTSLPNVLPIERQNFLKALVFHNAWDKFWAVVFSENVTLTDLEETIEFARSCLLANKNEALGVWLALNAAHEEAFNLSVFLSVCEMFKQKFNMSEEKIILFQKLIAIPAYHLLENFSHTLNKHNTELSDHVDLKAFLIVKFVQSSSNIDLALSLAMNQSQTDPRLHQIPGFASQLILETSNPQLVDYFASRRSALRNERDLYYLLEQSRPERHYQLFLTFCHGNKKGFLPSDFVINHFVLKTHVTSEKVFTSIVKSHYKVLTIETFSVIILSLLKTLEGRQILKTMSRRQCFKFEYLMEKLIHEEQNDHFLFTLLELTSTKGRISTRKTLQRLGSHHDYIEALLQYKFTEYNLTEVWRYGLRQNLLDSSNTGKLFQKTLLRCWNVKTLLRRAKSAKNGVFEGEFRQQYRHATVSERRRLKARLQAMGQALSLCEAFQISETLNNLWLFFRSENKFLLFRDNFGKQFVFNHLIKYTMRFIFRAGENAQAVKKMREVLKFLLFDSVVMQALIFEYMTMHRPLVSLEILESYKQKLRYLNRPIINGIEEGILKSRMEKEERLKLFQKFQSEIKRLGFGAQLNATTMTLMGSLIFDIANKNNDFDELKNFVQMAYRKGVSARAIKSWTKKP